MPKKKKALPAPVDVGDAAESPSSAAGAAVGSALPSGGAPLSNGQSSAAEQEDGLEDLDDLVELEGLDGTQDHFKELQERAAELARACAEKDETLGKLNEYAEMDAGEARLKLQKYRRRVEAIDLEVETIQQEVYTDVAKKNKKIKKEKKVGSPILPHRGAPATFLHVAFACRPGGPSSRSEGRARTMRSLSCTRALTPSGR